MKNIILLLVLYTVMITIYAASTIEEDHFDISELRNRRQTDYYDYEGDFTDQDYEAAGIARTANNRRIGRNKGLSENRHLKNQPDRNGQLSKKGQQAGNTKSRKQKQRPTNAAHSAVNRKGRANARRANNQQGRSRSPGRKSRTLKG